MNKRIPKINIPQGRELRYRLTMSIGIIFLIYMVVSTVQTLWQNYRLDRELIKLRDEYAELKLQNQYLKNLIAYRKTESFQDKEARSKLNFQKPGEIVLIIPEEDIDRFHEGNVKDTESRADIKREPTNPEKWWQFITGA